MESLTFTVDGIGEFSAHHRTIARSNQISLLADSLLDGSPEHISDATRYGVYAQAELMVLLDKIPDGWRLLDDLEHGFAGAHAEDAFKVYAALRSAEDRFRGGVRAPSEGAGAAT